MSSAEPFVAFQRMPSTNSLSPWPERSTRILNLDASVREEIKKHYIAYKTTTNFADIEAQKRRLKVTLNVPFPDIYAPKGLCKDITGIGHYGNGDVETTVSSLAQLDDVMDLIRQSFAQHQDENDA
jgi:predicted transport protein